MPRITHVLLGLGLALSAGLLAQSPGQPSSASGLVGGLVVDAAGAAVQDVVVFLRPAIAAPGPVRFGTPNQPVPVRTDSEGRFTFTGVPAGQYNVTTVKAGWLPGAFGKHRPAGDGEPFELADGQARSGVQVTIWRPGVIGGTVLDDNGDPLVGVEVRAIRQTFVAGRRQSVNPIRQKTNDLGEYRFPDLVPGDYIVAVLASVVSEPPSFAGAIRAGGETPRSYLQTMTAVGTAPIVFGRATGVTSPDRPLVGSLAHLPGMPSGEGVWATYPTTYHPNTLVQGQAAVVRVASGEVRDAVDIGVRLVPTLQVSGVLHDVAGPAPWHAVHLVAADTADTPLVDVGTAVTDSAGAFTFFGVPPGEYIARVVRTPYPAGEGQRLGLAGGTGAIPYVATFTGGPGSGPPQVPDDPLMHASQPVTVSDRHVRGMHLTMAPGPRIRGRVVFAGDAAAPVPAQMGQVRVFPMPAGGRQDNAVIVGGVTPDGEFVTSSLWPGLYVIRATAPPGWFFQSATHQGQDVSDSPLELTEDVTSVIITFVDKTSRLTGTVQAGLGAEIDRGIVIVFPVEPAAWVDYGRTSRRVISTGIAATGAFSMVTPPDGDYFIVAVEGDRVEEWQDPAFLKSLAPLAERLTVRGVAPPAQALRLQRIR